MQVLPTPRRAAPCLPAEPTTTPPSLTGRGLVVFCARPADPTSHAGVAVATPAAERAHEPASGRPPPAHPLPGLLPIYDVRGMRAIKVVAFDANSKLSRYKKLGQAHGSAEPVFGEYFGAADRRVQEAFAAGELRSAALAAAEAAAASEAPPPVVDDCPHPNLSCARATAKKGGILDTYGVAGACCAHGFPLAECFINMPTPEQFAYYDIMLNDVILQQASIMDMYLDVNCKYEPHWRRITDPSVQQEHSQLRFFVPEMHAKSHGQHCYQARSSMYHADAGRPIGEQMEQLWAMCKPYNSTRYMAAVNRHDFLDCALDYIVTYKALELPEQLMSTKHNTNKKLGEPVRLRLGCRLELLHVGC
jgi:hypothetical protein